MITISNVTDQLASVYQDRVQKIKETSESAQIKEQELSGYAKSLLFKIAEFDSEAIQKYDGTLMQNKKNYDSRTWMSTGFFPKAWAGLRLAFLSKPREISLSKLEPSYDYNDYENTKFYDGLRLLQTAGIVRINEEIHPVQSQGLPNYVPMGVSLTDEGKSYVDSFKKNQKG